MGRTACTEPQWLYNGDLYLYLLLFRRNYYWRLGTAVAQWLRCCATNRKVAGSIPDGVIGIFHWHKSSRSHYGPGVDSASNRNDYQENFLGVNAAGAYGWQPYHLPVPLSWNLGTLTSWEPLGHSRPVTGLICLFLLLEINLKKVTTLTLIVICEFGKTHRKVSVSSLQRDVSKSGRFLKFVI